MINRYVKEQIVKEIIQNSGHYSILVDKSKDFSKTEVLAIVVRYYFGGKHSEELLKLLTADEVLDAYDISQVALTILRANDFDVPTFVVRNTMEHLC